LGIPWQRPSKLYGQRRAVPMPDAGQELREKASTRERQPGSSGSGYEKLLALNNVPVYRLLLRG